QEDAGCVELLYRENGGDGECKIPRHRRSHRTNDKLGQFVGGRGKLARIPFESTHPLPLIPAHSASSRAFTPVFDGLWTRVNALIPAIHTLGPPFRRPNP